MENFIFLNSGGPGYASAMTPKINPNVHNKWKSDSVEVIILPYPPFLSVSFLINFGFKIKP